MAKTAAHKKTMQKESSMNKIDPGTHSSDLKVDPK
jgi:hypothetical protein